MPVISAHVYKESTVPPELCLDQNMIEYARAKLAVGKILDSQAEVEVERLPGAVLMLRPRD